MPTMQQKMRTRTGMTRSITLPLSFFARASVASSRAPMSGAPERVAFSCFFIGPKSNFVSAKKNVVKIVRIA